VLRILCFGACIGTGILCELRSEPGVFDVYFFVGLACWALAGMYVVRVQDALEGP
jgi:hypothetical protein